MTEHFRIAEWRILEWERDYSPLNVRQELAKMNNWLEANPRRRKKNYNRFIINWLNAEHAKIAHAQVQARISSRVGAQRPGQKADYSASDKAYYEQFYREHPDLKPAWWEA